MGTNFYLHRDACPHCGESKRDPLHIGKSSAGWVFSLHVYTHDDYDVDPPVSLPKSLEEWEALWSRPEHKIRDECGTDVAPEALSIIVRDRSWGNQPRLLTPLFLADNGAVEGPNGLVRHKLAPSSDRGLRGCLAHGEGTWDLIVGEFS